MMKSITVHMFRLLKADWASGVALWSTFTLLLVNSEIAKSTNQVTGMLLQMWRRGWRVFHQVLQRKQDMSLIHAHCWSFFFLIYFILFQVRFEMNYNFNIQLDIITGTIERWSQVPWLHIIMERSNWHQ